MKVKFKFGEVTKKVNIESDDDFTMLDIFEKSKKKLKLTKIEDYDFYHDEIKQNLKNSKKIKKIYTKKEEKNLTFT